MKLNKNMRTLTIFMVMSFVSPLLSRGQSVPTAESPAPARIYHLLREDDDWFLSLGGEAREVWEQIGNDNWGQHPFMNGYSNERYMLYFDVHYGKHIRSFVEVGTGDERNWFKFRVGRQEMEYGSGRLIDIREGPNVRLSFDGFKVKAGVGSWQIDGFAV